MKEQRINVESIDPALLRSLFSTRVLKQLALGVSPPEVEEVKRGLRNAEKLPPSSTLAEVFEASFRESVRSQRSEYAYKNAIVQKVLLGKYSLGTTSAGFEVRIGSSKLDVLLARDYLTAFEIKTERDELVRLSAQVRDYGKACRRIWVLTSERHVGAVERILPESVGIAVLTPKYQISTRRDAVSEAGRLELICLLRLLRKGEMISLHQKIVGVARTIPNTQLFAELSQVAASQPLEVIEKYVASAMLRRSAARAALLRVLPQSVAACALAMDLTTPQSERLISAFNADLTGESPCLPTIPTFEGSKTN